MIVGIRGKRTDIPHEPGEWMSLRTALSSAHIQRMRQVHKARGTEVIASLASIQEGRNFQPQMNPALKPVHEEPNLGEGEDKRDPTEREQRVINIRKMYDRFDMTQGYVELIRKWSYKWPEDEDIDEKLWGTHIPVLRDTVEDLDNETRRWLDERLYDALPNAEREDSAGNF